MDTAIYSLLMKQCFCDSNFQTHVMDSSMYGRNDELTVCSHFLGFIPHLTSPEMGRGRNAEGGGGGGGGREEEEDEEGKRRRGRERA